MKLQKRIKQIVSLTVEDFYSFGKSTKESKSETIEWINNALLTYEGLEDYTMIQISLQVLKLLNSLDIVDLEYLHATLFKDEVPIQLEVALIFEEVVQNG